MFSGSRCAITLGSLNDGSSAGMSSDAGSARNCVWK